MDTPAGKNLLVVASVIITPGGDTTGNNAAAGTIDAEEACPTVQSVEELKIVADGVEAAVDEAPTEHTGPFGGLYALFGGDHANQQVMPAIARSKTGALGFRKSVQPGGAVTPLPNGPGPQGLPQLPAPRQDRAPTLTPSRPTPQPERQATSAEHPGLLHPMISRVADVLRDPPKLVRLQKDDARLGPIGGRLRRESDRQTPEGTADYVVEDNDLLWSAPPKKEPKLAIPRALVPGMLALAHGTYGHPGVARILLLVGDTYWWPTIAQDTRDDVLSCGCRRKKRAWTQRVAMMPTPLLWPWKVLEMDLDDMKHVSSAGNRYLLVIVDRASRLLFAYPLESKDSVAVARKLLKLLLTFGVPISIRSDAGEEFTAKVVAHLCKWMRVSLNHGPSDHPRSQGAVERMGGGSTR